MSYWLWSIVGLVVCLSVSCAPFLTDGFMRTKLGGFTIASEEWRSRLIEFSLVSHEISGLPSVMRFLEVIFFQEASSCNFIDCSTQFTVALFSWDETGILWIYILFHWNLFLYCNITDELHVVRASSIHVILGPFSGRT